MSKIPGKVIGYTLTLALVCATTALNAQHFELFGGGGYASYSHPDLRDYQVYVSRNAGVQASIVEKFPAYYTYMGGFNVVLNKWLFTAEVSHGSTGGRVYYEDYSGKLTYDMVVTYTSFGLGGSYFIYRTDGISVTAGAKVLLVPTKLSVKNSVTIGSQTANEGKDFYGSNIGFQPYVAARKHFHSLFLQASAGYELQTSQFPESKDHLQLNSGSGGQVSLQGNGFRLALCVGLTLEPKAPN